MRWKKNRFPAQPLFDISIGSASFCPLGMKDHIMEGPWLCRNSWETFRCEELLALWNKVAFAVVSQCVCYLLPGGQLRSWGCSQGCRQRGGLHSWVSVRGRESKGWCGQGARLLPAPHSRTLVWEEWSLLKVYMEIGGLSARREVLGRKGQTALTKEHLHSPWCFDCPKEFVFHPLQRICWPFLSHKCLHL